MKLIGAGLPRTATTTQMIALEQLGLPCYHMRDMMADLGKGVDVWRRAYDGQAPWDEVFDGYESTGVDVPDEPLPHVNDTEAFKSQLMIGPAIASLSSWWEREQEAATAGSTAPAA